MFEGHPTSLIAGAPGRSKKVTVVPPGEVSLKIRSPINEWFTPTVVDVGSGLETVPSKRKFRSVIDESPLTANVILTPAGTLSGMGTAGPV